MKKLIVLACTMLAAACSTVTTDTAFAPSSPNGYMIVAGNNLSRTESHTYSFQRVDLTNATFLAERFNVFFGASGTLTNDELKVPEGLTTNLRFGGRAAAPAGDYALVSKSTAYGTGNIVNVNCYSLGAVIFRIAPGTINVTSMAIPRDVDVKAQVAQVLSGYPNISAPIGLTEIIGSAQFDGGKGPLGNQKCSPKGAFKFSARNG